MWCSYILIFSCIAIACNGFHFNSSRFKVVRLPRIILSLLLSSKKRYNQNYVSVTKEGTYYPNCFVIFLSYIIRMNSRLRSHSSSTAGIIKIGSLLTMTLAFLIINTSNYHFNIFRAYFLINEKIINTLLFNSFVFKKAVH